LHSILIDHRLNVELYYGDAYDILKKIPDNYIDSLVCDPPSGIGLMGNEWDSDKGGRDQWIQWLTAIMVEVHRVLKPGAHGLVWALPRTSHWTAFALENAGFEIRDVVAHLFGGALPSGLDIGRAIDRKQGNSRTLVKRKKKSQNKTVYGAWKGEYKEYTLPDSELGIKWEHWNTRLRPAMEHWILVRKEVSEKSILDNVLVHGTGALNTKDTRTNLTGETIPSRMLGEEIGNFPTNVVLTLSQDSRPDVFIDLQAEEVSGRTDASSGFVQFHYFPKASQDDRTENGKVNNFHASVKNTKLMEWLITLITPPQGIVLDCFMGSGSTGVAALRNGFGFIGIEKSLEYCDEIAVPRILAAIKETC